MGKMNGYRAENDEINREAFYGALSLTIFISVRNIFFLFLQYFSQLLLSKKICYYLIIFDCVLCAFAQSIEEFLSAFLPLLT